MKKFTDIKYFTPEEFQCKCGCAHREMDTSFITKLDALREAFGAPIRVTSGYRCPSHNKRIGGSMKSQHLNASAADITAKDLDKLYELAGQFFDSVGDGRVRGFIHVDNRIGIRRWTYAK